MLKFSALPPLMRFTDNNFIFSDFHVYNVGFCDFTRYESESPRFMHPHHTLHFILDGEGTYTIHGKRYHLKKNDVFYTPQGIPLQYAPSETNPWTYIWFAFVGTKAEEYVSQFSFHDNYAITPAQDEAIRNLITEFLHNNNPSLIRSENIRSFFFRFIELITVDAPPSGGLSNTAAFILRIAKDFMRLNFMNPNLTIQQVAKSIHVSHSYLCALFQAHEMYSAKEYLTRHRLLHASDLLKTTDKSITQISVECGYKDPLYFSSAFKKKYSVSPSNYRSKTNVELEETQPTKLSVYQGEGISPSDHD